MTHKKGKNKVGIHGMSRSLEYIHPQHTTAEQSIVCIAYAMAAVVCWVILHKILFTLYAIIMYIKIFCFIYRFI